MTLFYLFIPKINHKHNDLTLIRLFATTIDQRYTDLTLFHLFVTNIDHRRTDLTLFHLFVTNIDHRHNNLTLFHFFVTTIDHRHNDLTLTLLHLFQFCCVFRQDHTDQGTDTRCHLDPSEPAFCHTGCEHTPGPAGITVEGDLHRYCGIHLRHAHHAAGRF